MAQMVREGLVRLLGTYNYLGGVIISKIVIVHCSPRPDGNSSTLGKAIMDGAMGLSMNTISIHRLNNLHYVRGCQSCGRCKDSDLCVVEDDLLPVLEDIKTCDILVACFPLFFQAPCAQFKLLVDRMYCFLDKELKPKYPGKKLILVMTYDNFESDSVVQSVKHDLEETFCRDLGFEIDGFITYKCEHNVNTVANDIAMLHAARKYGKSLVKSDLSTSPIRVRTHARASIRCFIT